MKTKLLYVTIITLLSLFSSCESTITKHPTGETFNGADIGILVIDSCEYLIASDDVRTISHKGNCKFCAQRQKAALHIPQMKTISSDTLPIVSYKHPFDADRVFTTEDKSATFRSFSFRDSIVTVVSGRDTMDFGCSYHESFKHLRIDIMFAMNYFSLERINDDTLISADGIKYVRKNHSKIISHKKRQP